MYGARCRTFSALILLNPVTGWIKQRITLNNAESEESIPKYYEAGEPTAYVQ